MPEQSPRSSQWRWRYRNVDTRTLSDRQTHPNLRTFSEDGMCQSLVRREMNTSSHFVSVPSGSTLAKTSVLEMKLFSRSEFSVAFCSYRGDQCRSWWAVVTLKTRMESTNDLLPKSHIQELINYLHWTNSFCVFPPFVWLSKTVGLGRQNVYVSYCYC